jgi:hypothetical protein
VPVVMSVRLRRLASASVIPGRRRPMALMATERLRVSRFSSGRSGVKTSVGGI